jgi:hypothetical protein
LALSRNSNHQICQIWLDKEVKKVKKIEWVWKWWVLPIIALFDDYIDLSSSPILESPFLRSSWYLYTQLVS